MCVMGFPDPLYPVTDNSMLCIANAQLYLGVTYELLYRPSKAAEERSVKAIKILESFFADKGIYSGVSQS